MEHNIGLGGAAVVTVYQRAYGKEAPKVGAYSLEDDGRCRLGYNPAAEARVISKADWEAVKSKGDGSSKWATAKLPWVVDGESSKERAML